MNDTIKTSLIIGVLALMVIFSKSIACYFVSTYNNSIAFLASCTAENSSLLQ